MNACDYQDELLQRASEYYDPYGYVEDDQEPLDTDDEELNNFVWDVDE